MSITLIVEVIVLLPLLHTGSSIPACAEECCNEGQIVTYECQVPAEIGILDWNGVGFDCPNTDTIANNILGLPTAPCPLPFANADGAHTGVCGPYSGNLTCTEDGAYLISVLEFEANYEMNGGNISCKFVNTNKTEIFPVKVGVAPNPPSNVRVETRQDRSCNFEWTPPNESIGGIRGYKIHYGENCDRCIPEPGFVNQIEKLTAECIACIEEKSNIMCSFEVNTVSKDCSFNSPPVEVTSVLLPCILDTSSTTRVKIHSTIGDIPPGMEIVPHNTTLYFSCDLNCTLNQNQTYCTNGKFQPSIMSHILRDGCRCSDNSQYIIIVYVFGAVGGIVLVVALLIIISYWRKKRSIYVNPFTLDTTEFGGTVLASTSKNNSTITGIEVIKEISKSFLTTGGSE